MLMQTDPFRDLDTLFSRLTDRQPNRSGVMPMDAFRRGSDIWVHIDLPGVKAESLEITVFEPPSRIVITGQLGPFHATTSYLLEPAAGGTRLANDVELSPVSALLRPVAPLATASIKAAVARNLSTLKELLEGAEYSR